MMKIKSGLNVGTNDPTFKNTADVVNTMQAQVARVLKSTFGGQLSDDERKYLNKVYGALPSMSPTERNIAMTNVKTMLVSKRDAMRARMGGSSGTAAQNAGNRPQTVQRKGKDGQIYTYTLNPQTGQYE